MPDNRQIKDGLGNIFTMRMRDISSALDGSVQRSMFFATPYPLDYGGGGFYQYCAKSGIMLAAAPANSPFLSFRWTAAKDLAVISRVRLVVVSDTAFGPGSASFDIFVARQFTAGDTGENSANLAGNANKLRASMGSSSAAIVYSNTVPIAVGTRVLDPAPIDSRSALAPNAPYTLFSNMPVTIFEKLQGDHPLVLGFQEGFVLHVTVPNTGSWKFSATLEWAEIPAY
jgi:hypothetical protein